MEWAAQTTSAAINSSKKRYQIECERIEDVRLQLKASIDKQTEELKRPFSEIEKLLKKPLNEKDSDSITEQLLKDLDRITAILVDDAGKTRSNPFLDWERDLTKAIESITNSVLDALEDGKSISGNKAFEYANPKDLSVLEALIQGLINEGYREYAGKKFQARTQEEKDKLRKLNKQLNALSYSLEPIVNDVARKVLDREVGRIKDAMKNLFVFHLESLKKTATDIAPDLGINFPQSKLITVDSTLRPKFSFKGGFPILPESYTEEVIEKTGTRRFLFFFKKDVYEARIEERSGDNADIPSFKYLGMSWKLQKSLGNIEVYTQTFDWLLKQIDKFNTGVESFQSEVVDRYQARLDRAYQDTQIDYDSKMEIWQPLKEEAEMIASQINQLGAEWKNR